MVRPTRGVRVRTLPPTTLRIVIPSGTYYYYYGNFYVEQNSEYEIVEPPLGAVVNAIPENYEVKEINRTEYYLWQDTYFLEVDAKEYEEGVGYEVVSLENQEK